MSNERELERLENELNREPNNPELLAQLGKMYLQANRVAEAVVNLKRAVAMGGASGHTYFSLGLAQALAGNISEAVEGFVGSVDEEGDPDLNYVLDVDELTRERVARSIVKDLSVLATPGQTFNYGAALTIVNAFSESLVLFDRLQDHESALPQLSLWRTLDLWRLGYTRDALQAGERYTQRAPKDAFGFYLLGLVRFAAKEHARSIQAYQKALELRPGYLKASLRLAQGYMMAEQFPKVEQLLRSILAAHPDCVEAYFGLGKCLEKEYRIDEALEMVKKAVELAPGVGEYQLTAGQLSKALGRNDLALDYFRQASKLSPQDGEIYFNLGSILCTLNRYSEAIPELEKAVRFDKRNGYAYYNLGVAYARANRLEKAVSAFEKSVEYNPRELEALYEMGVLQYRLGEYTKAEETLKRFLANAPHDVRAPYYLALCHRSQGQASSEQELLESVGANESEEMAGYRLCADYLHRGQARAAASALVKGSKDFVPTQKRDFFSSALLQLWGSKVIELNDRLREEREYANNIEDSLFQFMSVLAALSDLRDAFCQSHSQRVAVIADLLALGMGVGEELRNGIHVGACLHDVGKIALPDMAMYYSEEEGEVAAECNSLYEQHTLLGYDHVSRIPFPEGVVEAIQSHHEAWNGSGFPEGLKEDSIPLAAQIVGIADYLERLLTRGVGGSPCSPQAALDIIKAQVNISFSKPLVDALIAKYPEIMAQLQNFEV